MLYCTVLYCTTLYVHVGGVVISIIIIKFVINILTNPIDLCVIILAITIKSYCRKICYDCDRLCDIYVLLLLLLQIVAHYITIINLNKTNIILYISAVQYACEVGGSKFIASGTSAATPVIAGFFSNINAARLAQGKGSLGWVTPALYTHGKSFVNDITVGHNYCVIGGNCCPQGFVAGKNWDPTTGLGTPNYGKMHDVLVALGSEVNRAELDPTMQPTQQPSTPTEQPTQYPTQPTMAPSLPKPSHPPTVKPSAPTYTPTRRPTSYPSVSRAPSIFRLTRPTLSPLPASNSPTSDSLFGGGTGPGFTTVALIVITAILCFILCLCLVLVGFCCWKRCKKATPPPVHTITHPAQRQEMYAHTGTGGGTGTGRECDAIPDTVPVSYADLDPCNPRFSLHLPPPSPPPYHYNTYS